jgi:polar amino acid transport system substrate-binding protein
VKFVCQRWLLGLLLLSLLPSLKLLAKENVKHIYGCEKPLNAALFESGLLFSVKQNRGSSKDLLELLAAESGCEIQLEIKPRARIWSDIKSGDTAMTTNGLISAERQEFAAFAPYVSGKNIAFIRKELGPVKSFDDIANLKGTYIGVVRKYKHGNDIDDFIEKMKKLGRVREFTDDAILNRVFAAGGVGVMFQMGLTYKGMLEENHIEDKVNIVDLEKHPVMAGVVFSKKRFTAEQIKAWQDLVLKLRKSGKLKKIYVKFFGQETADKYLL